MRTNLLYSEYVKVTEDLDIALKKCFVNHLVIYNYGLNLLYHGPEMTFNNLKRSAITYIRQKNISPVLDLAIYNELYYQFKKFKRNIRVQKLVTAIQYFTFLLKGYQCKCLEISEDRSTITFIGLPGVMQLTTPLPELNEEDIIYLNLSYSNQEDRYKLSSYLSAM